MPSSPLVINKRTPRSRPPEASPSGAPPPAPASREMSSSRPIPSDPLDESVEYDQDAYPFPVEVDLSYDQSRGSVSPTSRGGVDDTLDSIAAPRRPSPAHQPNARGADSPRSPGFLRPDIDGEDEMDLDGYTAPPRRSVRRYTNSARPPLGVMFQDAPPGALGGSRETNDPFTSPLRNATPPRSALRSSLTYSPAAPDSPGTPIIRHQASPLLRGHPQGECESPTASPRNLTGSPQIDRLAAQQYSQFEDGYRPTLRSPPGGRGSVPSYHSRNSFAAAGGDRQWEKEEMFDESLGEVNAFGGEEYKQAYSPFRRRSLSDPQAPSSDMRRRGTREMEEQSRRPRKGFLKNLFSFGRSTAMQERPSRHGEDANGTADDLPTNEGSILTRTNSLDSSVSGADELDANDPRLRAITKKKRRMGPALGDLGFMRNSFMGSLGKKKKPSGIQRNLADVYTRQAFILKLAKALMTFGAPSHRIESQLAATAIVLEMDAQFIHFPSLVIASFGDPDTRTSETHFIKASSGLDLGKLHRVHSIYKNVVHDELDAAEGTRQIHALLRAPQEYGLIPLMIMAFLSSGLIAPMGFSGSILDGVAAGLLGMLLSFLQMNVAQKNQMYSNIFEISIATVISFAARGLSQTGFFCYQAVASAGVVLILPGYTILCGSLELASKNIVAGSVRMIYAIIYSLFLGFGITIGSDLFYVVDPPARRAAERAVARSTHFVSLSGQFIANNSTYLPLNGTFSFSNATTNQMIARLKEGTITCSRDPTWPWWRQTMPAIYLIGFIPVYSCLCALWNFQPIRSKELPVMVFISCVGYFTNSLANRFIFDRSDIVSAIGAFVVGIMGNIYSRVFGGTAFTSMVPGVLFLVPSGISAAGGLAMSSTVHRADSYSQGLIIGFRMIQVAIGITVGLFGSGFLIYSFGRKKSTAVFAF